VARIQLGEYFIGQLVTFFTSTLPTELAAIDTDAADGVILAEPAAANIYGYEKLEISGGTKDTTVDTEYPVHLEIFEGDLVFTHRDSDQSSGRLTYEAEVQIRLTWFNSRGDTKPNVELRRRRYSAGLVNVLSKNPILGLPTTQPILGVHPTGILYDRDLDQGGMLKQRITMTAQAKVEEVQP